MVRPIFEEISITSQMLLILLVFVILLGVVSSCDLQTAVIAFFRWLKNQGVWAPTLFILVDALIVLFLLPGLLFSFAAGFMFGVVWGSVYFITGTTLGASAAFLLARTLRGTDLANYFLRNQRLALLHNRLANKGWGLILLTRLIPFFPFKLSNYFFGLAGYSFPHFVIGTALGIIPISLFNVYTGSLAAELSLSGLQHTAQGTRQLALYGLLLIALGSAVLSVTRLAHSKLKKYLSQNAERSREACMNPTTHGGYRQ